MENNNTEDNPIKKVGEKENIDTEIKTLKSKAHSVFMILGLIIVTSGILLGLRDTFSINLIWACITAGILGSTSSALISALQRKANGWETEDGTKHPPDGKKEMFSQRMATFFLYRPILGIIGGLLIYFGMQAKIFGEKGVENQPEVIFWSLLAGLFVKSLLEKLKDLFDNLIGKK